jgi:iron complex transport system permease protein
VTVTSPVTGRVLRSRGGRVSLRIDPRSAVVCGVLVAVAAGVGVVSLATGDYPVPVRDVVAALLGRGDAATGFVVGTLRLPRLLTGLLVGAALGLSGAVLQSVTRNPLGSPDVVGFTTGSATGALLVITVLHGSMADIAAGALAGGLVTVAVVYALAYRHGAEGLRLVLVGVGISALLLAVNHYLVTRASVADALAAQMWLTGSLNGRRWEHAAAAGIAVGLLAPLAVYLGRRLVLLELGDDTARALGVPVERTRLVLVVASVALAAVATAVAGPIAFVALAAPQVARRLTGSAGPGLLPAAYLGAVLLVVSDLVTQRVFAPSQLPVGLATGAIGGVYLAWLLAREWRRNR